MQESITKNGVKVYIQNNGVYGMIVVVANSLEEATAMMQPQYNYDNMMCIVEYDLSTITEPTILDVSLGDC